VYIVLQTLVLRTLQNKVLQALPNKSWGVSDHAEQSLAGHQTLGNNFKIQISLGILEYLGCEFGSHLGLDGKTRGRKSHATVPLTKYRSKVSYTKTDKSA
jgi:hypothetical protein